MRVDTTVEFFLHSMMPNWLQSGTTRARMNHQVFPDVLFHPFLGRCIMKAVGESPTPSHGQASVKAKRPRRASLCKSAIIAG